jgi:hypothetical protein
MEIKKYALLEDKTIQECNEDKMHITSDNYLAMNSGMIIDKVLKTSNNILDLVEEGDLVDILFTGNNTYHKLEVMEITDRSLITSHLHITKENMYGFTYDETKKIPFIRTLFKLQPNGDYKKYEVKA